MKKELGPCMVVRNLESTFTDNTTLTFIVAKEASKSAISVLVDSCYHASKNIIDAEYIEICLKYKKRVKVWEIPFFLSFIKELKNPKPTYIALHSQLENVRNKKLNTMIIKPVQPIRMKKFKEFYFGGLAYWELITVREKI